MAKETAAKKKVSLAMLDEHPGHSQHLCELVRARQMGRVAQLAKGATCLCLICGRAAAKGVNLCESIEI